MSMAQKRVSDELLELLNKAIANELQGSIQYMWQHVLAMGIKGHAVKGEFRKIAIVEMKHAEAIAERLHYLGGVPTTQATPIVVGDSLKAMIEQDKRDEEKAIAVYMKVLEQAEKENDPVTKKLFEDILEDEQEHHHTFTMLLEDL
jgi:bacterioferritin